MVYILVCLGAWQIASRVSLPIPRAFIPENLVRPGLYEHAFSGAVHDPPPARRVSLRVTDFLVLFPSENVLVDRLCDLRAQILPSDVVSAKVLPCVNAA